MHKLRVSMMEEGPSGFEIMTSETYCIDKLKLRRFQEIFENDISELRRVELCPLQEAKEYEDENDWPMTEAI